MTPPKDGPLWYFIFPVAVMLLFLTEKLETMSIKKRFVLMAILAFASFISFIQIESWFAEKNNISTLFWISGFAFGMLATWNLAIIVKQADRGPED